MRVGFLPGVAPQPVKARFGSYDPSEGPGGMFTDDEMKRLRTVLAARCDNPMAPATMNYVLDNMPPAHKAAVLLSDALGLEKASRARKTPLVAEVSTGPPVNQQGQPTSIILTPPEASKADVDAVFQAVIRAGGKAEKLLFVPLFRDRAPSKASSHGFRVVVPLPPVTLDE